LQYYGFLVDIRFGIDATGRRLHHSIKFNLYQKGDHRGIVECGGGPSKEQIEREQLVIKVPRNPCFLILKKVVNSVRSCKMVGCIKHSIFTEKKTIVGCKNEVQFPFRLMAAIVEDKAPNRISHMSGCWDIALPFLLAPSCGLIKKLVLRGRLT